VSDSAGARFRRVEELFAAALALPAADRAVYLERAADGDEALAAEVAALLDEDDSSRVEGAVDLIGAAVESGAREILAGGPPAGSLPAGSLVGRRIGPWQVVDTLGQGGLSTVYLALRADEQFRKRVALKVLKRGMDTDEILLRFRNERQILASLEHPNIARLIDAGSTEEGLSYFVMEYVEGVPLDRYCDTQRLGVEARLELFEAVCSAVAYAHRNLVVHRDLKPSNILVTPQGVPKLLDFGIAKLLNPEMAAGNLELTLGPWSPMTPSYASPEQVHGEPVTTATDVYSLGVLLYELLSGRRPYAVSALRGDLGRVVGEVEPEPPSAALARRPRESRGAGERAEPAAAELARRRNSDPRRLRRQLEGDLDTIVLTALRKEPQRRYASAEHMADDLRRHLRGLPVAARRDTFRYQAGKFLRRHRAGAAAAAAALALGTLFVVLLAVQSLRLARERTVSEQERRRAETVSEFLVELFQVSEPGEAQGGTITARELLDRGAERVAALDGQPLVQATLMQTIGQVYEQLGLYDDAAPLLEQAVALRREHLGPEHPEVADSLNRLAVLRAKAGSYDLAEPLFRSALEIRRKAYGEEDRRVAESLNNLALLLHEKGDYGAAEKLYLRATRLDDRLPRDPGDPVSTRSNLALLYHDQGRYAQAEQLYRQTLSRAEQAGGPRHPEVARLRAELGVTLLAAGREQPAEDLLRQAVEIRRDVLGPHHPDLARSLRQLATLLVRQGRLDEAIPLHREALAIRRLAGSAHPEVADSLAALAEALAVRGEHQEAVEHLSQALAIYRNALPAAHPFTADVLVALGRLHCETGEPATGETLLREGIGIRRQSLAARDPRLAEAETLLERCRPVPRVAAP
jgi:serine/threonine-protein kinase